VAAAAKKPAAAPAPVAAAPFWDVEELGYESYGNYGQLSAWNVVFLGGMSMPGLAEVTNGACERKLDIKNAKGADGATISHNGYEPAKLDVLLTLATPQDWSLFQQVLPLIKPKLGKLPSQPLAFSHPSTDPYGIDKVIVESVGIPKKGKVPGTREVHIKLVQWAPSKKTGALKKGGIIVPRTTRDQERDTAAAAKLPEFVKNHPERTGPPSLAELEAPSNQPLSTVDLIGPPVAP
jgi:hypothetical protein